MSVNDESFISHLEALRGALLRCVAATALLYFPAYAATPYITDALVRLAFAAETGTLHYFAPLEVFITRLRLALVVALIASYPWNALQIWRFISPALYKNERAAFVACTVSSSALFFCGALSGIFFMTPLVMKFSGGFATETLTPNIGVANFLSLAGLLALSFGLMFQAPVITLLAVRLGVISAGALAAKRPYVMTLILIAAAFLTPPDVISQLMLAIPTWLLFEAGLVLARSLERKKENATRAPAEEAAA